VKTNQTSGAVIEPAQAGMPVEGVAQTVVPQYDGDPT
jgi:hypothetical protein